MAGTLTQAFLAPLAFLAVPVTGLLVVARPRRPLAVGVGIVCAVVTLSWLAGAGELPDQVARAATVLVTVAFAVTSARTPWSFTHRALFALAVAAVALAAWFVLFGWSWGQLHWWVTFRAGAALRLLLAAAAPAPTAATVNLDAPGFDEVLHNLVQTTADLYPAGLALQLLVGLLLAAAVVPRLAQVPVGQPLGRLAEFRFSEHLGWVLAVALVVVLVPALHGVRPLAVNVLVLMAALYGVRGLAVVAAGLRAIRAGVFLYVLAAIAIFFLLPAVVLLGVLDAGLNLRRRRAPRSGA